MTCRDGSCERLESFCWSLGLYVYEELMEKYEEGAPYYALPKRIEYDGIRNHDSGDQCSTTVESNSTSPCRKMTKLVFYQYQYVLFYIIGLIIFFLLPFVLYTAVNNELVMLHDLTIEKESDAEVREKKADLIVKRFFKAEDEVNKMRWYKRVWGKFVFNIIIRFLYIVVYVVGLRCHPTKQPRYLVLVCWFWV